MKNLIKLLVLLTIIVSCKKTPDIPPVNYVLSGGVFIMNEGNFRGGNGSLSFYSYDSLKIYNNVFNAANGRPLGDVPFSMVIKDDKAYIVVNNSGKIEVTDQSTLQSKATISGLISPRNMMIINDSKAYVSSLYSDSVAIVSLSDNSISGYINIRRTSEAMVMVGNKAFVSNWAGGNEIMVINTTSDAVIDSIKVGLEPQSMAIDKNGMLWVLCDGGWSQQDNAKLIQINPASDLVVKTLPFPAGGTTPSNLRIDGLRQNLYYIDNGVKQMDISSADLPGTTFVVQKTGESFYNIGINPVNGDVFVTDAVDYSQQGYVSIYNSKGTFISKVKAGIIPGNMYFKIRINTQTS
jgi:YVTN family beta-propeller protein